MLCSTVSCQTQKFRRIRYSIKRLYSMKHEQFLKIPSIFIKKSRWRKGRSWINPTFFEPMLILSTLFCSAVCPLVKSKRYDGSDKASRVYSRWNMSISKKIPSIFIEKSRWKKGRSWITPTVFEPILILSTFFCSSIRPLVKCKSYDGSEKAWRVYSRWNMSNS